MDLPSQNLGLRNRQEGRLPLPISPSTEPLSFMERILYQNPLLVPCHQT